MGVLMTLSLALGVPRWEKFYQACLMFTKHCLTHYLVGHATAFEHFLWVGHDVLGDTEVDIYIFPIVELRKQARDGVRPLWQQDSHVAKRD